MVYSLNKITQSNNFLKLSENDWSLSELKRQYDSSLYERLASSKNKDEVILLSEKEQIIEKPAYAIKDPYVLELPVYSEIELENKII